MKRKIALTLALSALIFTACNSNSNTAQTGQSTAAAAETFKTEQSSEEAVPAVQPEYYAEIPENMRLFNFAKLNTEGEYTTVHNPAMSNDIKAFVNRNIICSFCKVTSSDGSASSRVLRFYNIDNETVEKTIPLPDGCRINEFIGGSEDILCKASLTEYVTQDGSTSKEQSIITVKNDYSYDFSEYTPQNAALPIGGHNIAKWYLDIFDADRNMTLMEGSESEIGDGTFSDYRYHVYMFPIDENRFVYLTGGHEYTSCFGIYDFRTDTCSDLPDTADMRPIGIRNGKIYSVLKPWDKTASDIYVTNIETLETVKCMSCPKALNENDQMYYSMPESGGHILYMYAPGRGRSSNIIGIADPDAGDTLREYEIPYGNEFYSQLYLKDENIAVIISDRMDKALIIDMRN